MWRRTNPNPCGKAVGDCAVRAVSLALGVDWYTAYDLLCAEGRRQCNMPSANEVINEVLRRHGFVRISCPDSYTARSFLADHPRGLYVLVFSGHIATARDGVLFDAWDSSNETPIYYYRG